VRVCSATADGVECELGYSGPLQPLPMAQNREARKQTQYFNKIGS
jgi:hypothetical protein